MKLRLKGAEILKRSGAENAHQLALKSQVSYPTVDRWVNRPETVKSIDSTVLAALLAHGWGLSADEILNLKLGEVFELENGTH